MTLKDVVNAGCRYHITVQERKTDINEVVVDGVETVTKTFNVLVDLVVFNPSVVTGANQESLVMCRVQASGSGATGRLAERDAIKECLLRVVL